MNSNTPYNSGIMKNMVNKVKVYCSRIIPLVFDNTLSYYETLCGFCAKVNELCDAVNSQNLAITEFCHMVELEIEKFKEYVDTQISTINETISDILDRVRDIESAVGDIETALANKLDKSDVTNVVEENNENPVSSGAVFEAIQNSSGTTVREAQANPTHGFVKGILSTDFQDRANPLSIYNGTLIMRPATENQTGYVQIGENIRVENGVISVPLASPTAKGLVMASNVDSGITVFNGTMRINLADPLYIDTTRNRVDIKTATNTQLGVVAPKLGGALNIQSAGEIDAKDATISQRGVVTLTDTISSGDTSHVPTSDAVFQAIQGGGGGGSVPDATNDVKGKVKPGAGLTIATATPGVITLLTATRDVIGGVKVGNNINISTEGVISVPTAMPDNLGLVTISGTDSNLTMGAGGVLDVPNASTTTKGVVSVGDNLRITNGVLSVPNGSTTTRGAVMVDSVGSISANQGVIDVKLGDYMTRNQTGAISPTVADDTAGTLGVVGSALGGAITINNGEIDVKHATTSQRGVVQLTSTLGAQLTNVVPTADVVWNECAPRGLENLAVRSATPDSDGTSQLYKVDAQGVSTNVTPKIPDASLSTKGLVKLSNSFITNSNGQIEVKTGANITKIPNTGALTVPYASTSSAGVVGLTDSVVSGDNSNVPTNNAVYQAITRMLQNGGFSRTLQLEHNSDPNGGAECIFVISDSPATNITPTTSNIVNGNDVNNTRINFPNAMNNYVHLFVKVSLYPTSLDYNGQMKTTEINGKPNQYHNSWDTSYNIAWNTGNTFTNSNGIEYRHIYTTSKIAFNNGSVVRVKIDY